MDNFSDADGDIIKNLSRAHGGNSQSLVSLQIAIASPKIFFTKVLYNMARSASHEFQSKFQGGETISKFLSTPITLSNVTGRRNQRKQSIADFQIYSHRTKQQYLERSEDMKNRRDRDFVSSLLKNTDKTLVTLQPETQHHLQFHRRKQAEISSHDKDNFFHLSNTDVVLMAKYLDDNPAALVIFYRNAWELRPETVEDSLNSAFVLKVLENFSPETKIYVEVHGVSTFVDENGRQAKQSFLVNFAQTSIFFGSNETAKDVEGSLVFHTVESNHPKIEVCEILVQVSHFPFEIRRDYLPALEDLNHKTVRNFFTINGSITSGGELQSLFLFHQKENLSFHELFIDLTQMDLSKSDIRWWSTLSLKVCKLQLKLTSKSEPLVLRALLEKIPKSQNINLVGPSNFVDLFSISSTKQAVQENETQNPNLVLYDEVFNFFSSNSGSDNPQTLTLTGLEVPFTSVQSVFSLKEALIECSKSRKSMYFSLLRSFITIQNFQNNASLFFMIVLTSNNPKQDFQHLKHKIATERFSLTHVTLFSTKFVNCQLQLVEIEADIFVQTLADLAWLLKVWQIGNNLDVNCEKLSIWCDGIDYGWLFQLVKKKSFDSNCISNAMDQMKFDRSKLYWIEGVLSNGAKERNSERQPNVKQNKIDIKVGLSDSRCELIKLIDIFCHSLNLYGIVTRSLVIEVEMDNNEWAFFKFLLTRRKTTIVINDVVVIFPENATEESRMVAIEVITIPKKLIQDRCKEEGISVCDVSPIIFIDQAEKIPYAEPVHVYLPCPSVSEDYETQIFSKHPPEISDWELVKEWSEVRYGGKSKLLYKSKIFSPVNGVTQKKSDRKVNPGLFSNPQQANVAYATITALEHRPGNVVFDCVRAKNDNYMQLLKVSPYTEVREVGPMHKKDKLLAYLRGDFAVERPKLKNNNMIEFSCPDCVSNQQEYKMKKIEGNGDSLGIVDYVLQSKKGRTDLFHMFYQMPTNIVYPRSTSSTNSELERPHYSHKFQG